MTLDPFTALAGFVTLLQGVVAVGLLLAVLRTARGLRRPAVEGAPPGADAVALLAGPAVVLLVLSVAAWPLLLFLLQSYVPLWAGVMCIQGVLRVGTGSPGAPGLLPGLVATLQLTKPALVFVAGAWLALHRLDRRTRTAPLARRILGLLAVLGLLALVDAGIEGTYLAIPKREQSLALGCCSFRLPEEEGGLVRRLLSELSPEASARALALGGGALLAALLGGILLGLRSLRGGRAASRGEAAVLAGLAAAAVPVGSAWFSDVAAPRLLSQPDHRCPYCLLAQVPASGVGAALFLLGTFSVGWAALLVWMGRHEETAEGRRASVRRLLRMAGAGYAGAGLLALLGHALG